jgi:hypothetical protein
MECKSILITSGSQEERIGILKAALAHKGVSSDSGHYDIQPPGSDSTINTGTANGHQNSSQPGRRRDIPDHTISTPQTAAEGGIDL